MPVVCPALFLLAINDIMKTPYFRSHFRKKRLLALALSCGMLLSAVHEEDGSERLSLLMLDDKIPAGAKLC